MSAAWEESAAGRVTSGGRRAPLLLRTNNARHVPLLAPCGWRWSKQPEERYESSPWELGLPNVPISNYGRAVFSSRAPIPTLTPHWPSEWRLESERGASTASFPPSPFCRSNLSEEGHGGQGQSTPLSSQARGKPDNSRRRLLSFSTRFCHRCRSAGRMAAVICAADSV